MITLFRLALGGVFLVTGISKIPIFDAFAYSITELVPLSGLTLTVTAAAVIAFEIIAGIALLINKGTKLFSAMLSIMLVSFIILLSGALFRYESYICTCFGVLGLELPVNEQIIVDFVLLNMAVFVFIFSRSESRFFERVQKNAPRIIIPVLLISVIWSALVITQPREIFGEKPEITVDARMVFNELPYMDSYHPRLVLMIDVADFLCPQCLDDFLGMAERITDHSEEIQTYVYILTKQIEFMNEEEQREHVERWRSDHNFPFPMKIDTNNIFTRAGFDKSTALLFSGLGSLEDIETFPMGSRRRNEIIDRFFRN